MIWLLFLTVYLSLFKNNSIQTLRLIITSQEETIFYGEYKMNQTRLNLEKSLVENKFGYNFLLLGDSYDGHRFVGWTTTAYGGNDYELTLQLGSNYPDKRPELYITCPTYLQKFGGNGYINDIGTSHAFHIWDNGSNGCVQICHSENWDATNTCLGALLRGCMWLEFYESYLKNGGDINQYCN